MSDFITEITGHIDGDLREIKLRDGVGCAFRILTVRSSVDEFGTPSSRQMWIPVITYDTNITAQIMRSFQRGSFVRVFSRELRTGTPREYNRRLYNNYNFVIDTIEDAREPIPTAPSAEASVLAGVTA